MKGKLYLIIFLFLIGFLIRFWGIGEKPLWTDEAISFHYADPFHKDISSLIKEVREVDAHPPLYYLILHMWLEPIKFKNRGRIIYYPNQIFSEGYIRYLSLIFGIISIFVFYFLEKGEKLGFLLFIFSSFHIFYCQEARNYSLVLLFSLLSLLAIRIENKWKWLLLIFSWVGGLYTYIYFSMFILAEDLWYLVFERKKNIIIPLIFVNMVSLLAISPYIPLEFHKLLSLPAIPVKITPEYHLFSLFNVPVHLAFGEVFPFPSLYIFILFLFIMTIIFFPFFGKSYKEDWLYFITFFLPLVVSSLLPVRTYLFEAKYVIFSLPPLLLLISRGIKSVNKKFLPFFLSLFIFGNLLSFVFYSSKIFQKEKWKDAVDWVEKEENDAVVLFDPDFTGYPFDFYYWGKMKRFGYHGVIPSYRKIFLIQDYSSVSYPSIGNNDMKKNFYEIKEKIFKGYNGNIKVSLWEKKK